MTLEALTRHLGVTTGSFYHHFGSHAGFLDELTDKYIQDYTYVVGEYLETLDLPPRERLIAALEQIVGRELGGMDVHFRGLAMSFPRVAKKIRAMDGYRTALITEMFEGMGYEGDELRMRVHNFVVVNSMEHAVNTSLKPGDRLALLDERIRLLID